MVELAVSKQIRRVVLAQFGVTVAIALALLMLGKMQALSGLLGGCISACTNGMAALRFFAPYQAQAPAKLLASFYGVEIQKILLTGLLFAGLFAALDGLSIGALLGTYLIVQVAVPMVVLLSEDQVKIRYK